MFSRIRSRFRHEQANANEMFMVCPHCHQWGEFGRCGFCGFDAGDPQAVTRLRATRASGRARQRAFWQQTYDLFDNMFHFHAADFVDFLRNAVKWTVLGGAVGVKKTLGRFAIAASYNQAVYLPVDSSKESAGRDLAPPSRSPSTAGRYDQSIVFVNANASVRF